MDQPGYDALADVYAETFPTPYQGALERCAIDLFVDDVRAHARAGLVIDIGSGVGHVTADLTTRGLDVVGVEPSAGMRALAVAGHPACTFLEDDAYLHRDAAALNCAALLARYSLIHVSPEEIPHVLGMWAARLAPGSPVLVAFQSRDDPGVVEFDHRVARAWRWYPDDLAHTFAASNFDEVWRMVSRPDTARRFPETQMLLRRR
ncbi:class I SAM-dependent methyltransferase [Gordonia aichiensis]|uniref:Putative methyltransferase n=1 Tax=Gordonia aichiensis NBRC 108223 TaxID=1220583 RepID=L7KLM3_9ACTN|nr:class I SAM-dependent methyltransferase [Gordonia aichiensis]GAC49401.1 putative methyltransferase [Gordonia aichiensis NBRC 108223]